MKKRCACYSSHGPHLCACEVPGCHKFGANWKPETTATTTVVEPETNEVTREVEPDVWATLRGEA